MKFINMSNIVRKCTQIDNIVLKINNKEIDMIDINLIRTNPELVKKNIEKKTPKASKGNKKEAPLPDWYSDYEKNLQNLENKENVNNKELEEIAKKLFED